MKFLKTALVLSAMAAMFALTGCTACDNANTSSYDESTSSSSMMPSEPDMTSDEGSVLPSEPSMSSNSDTSSAADTSSSMIPTLSTDFSEIGALDGELVVWGPGTHRDENMHPTDLDVLQEKFGKYNCWFYGKEKGKLYLTFDEGYENGYTAKILDVLKEKQVPAVFFVTMHYVKTNPELVQRMIDEGHVVGNHSDKHPAGGYVTWPLDAVQKDIMSLHDYVKENFDYTMNVFRYPEGTFSEQTAALIGKIGYKQLFWSFAYNDYDVNNQPSTEEACERIVSRAHDGAIYLLHAVSSANTAALPQAIDDLREKGFEFALFEEAM